MPANIVCLSKATRDVQLGVSEVLQEHTPGPYQGGRKKAYFGGCRYRADVSWRLHLDEVAVPCFDLLLE